jgi:glyoxylase-like metal-dependent hydrolase (beta-lactamase superfamily II)/ferredoxin
MAHLTQRRPENTTGDFYVDSTCIDCDTCRWMAPAIFHRSGSQSAVYHQPGDTIERQEALQALLSCPTSSIGTVEKPKDIQTVQQQFPLLVAENVFHCGYHSEQSFGAATYLIQRPDGNVLVDSPRFTPPLVKRLEEMGGVRYLYLTHRDDVADHQKFHDHFGCDRLLHEDDITEKTRGVEMPLQGSEPIAFAPDLLIIPVPGHTKGHTVLLYGDRFLFTGDHLAWSASEGQLIGFRRACWYSWPILCESMKKLTHYRFEWVLPGHGRRYHADAETMQTALQKCLAWL